MNNHALKSVALAALVAAPAFAATAYINQIGYRPGDFKELALVDANGSVDFVNAAGQVVLSVTASVISTILSSSSLICTSALVTLLLFPFNVFLICYCVDGLFFNSYRSFVKLNP